VGGASGLGLPVSTTHTLVGAILGVGMARGITALNRRVIGTIYTYWVVTLPAGAILSIISFLIFQAIFVRRRRLTDVSCCFSYDPAVSTATAGCSVRSCHAPSLPQGAVRCPAADPLDQLYPAGPRPVQPAGHSPAGGLARPARLRLPHPA